MSVKIRLMRMGKKKQPSYRVVVADGRSPRDGRYIEIIGHYQPRHEPSSFEIDGDKVLAWLHQGAQPTEQVHRLLVSAGIWEAYESSRGSRSLAARNAERKAKGQAAARERAAAAAKAAAAKAAADAAAVTTEPGADDASADEGGEE